MKVDELTKQVTVPQPLPGKADRAEQATGEAHAEAASKQKGKDKVQLSGMSPVAVDHREQDVARAQRVSELKASVASGSYKVPARAVAEAMVSKLAGTGTKH